MTSYRNIVVYKQFSFITQKGLLRLSLFLPVSAADKANFQAAFVFKVPMKWYEKRRVALRECFQFLKQ
jgi:hypothetical protein